MRRGYCILAVLLMFSCKSKDHLGHNPSHVNQQQTKKYLRLSYTPLEVFGFKFHQGQGIDSYVGRIQKDSILFVFDFGQYTSAGVLSQREIKHRIISNKNRYLSKCGLSTYSNDYLEQELAIVQVIDKDSISQRPAIDLICFDTYCVVDGFDDNHNQFLFEEKDTLGFYSKIYVPKIGSPERTMGLIVQRELNNDITYSDQRLGMNSYGYVDERKEEMLNYLRAARDAFIEENKDKLD